MNDKPFKAKAYLKVGCPYSFRYLLFMSEALLLDQIEIVRCDPEEPQFNEIKTKLAGATGREATFPTVEIEPDIYKSDSAELIEYYAAKHRISSGDLPALAFYCESIFPQLEELHEH